MRNIITKSLLFTETILLGIVGVLAVVSVVAREYLVIMPIFIPFAVATWAEEVLGVTPGNGIVWIVLYYLLLILIPIVSIVAHRKKYLALNICFFVVLAIYACLSIALYYHMP